MDKVISRIDFIIDNNEYNRLIYRLGYLKPEIFRDLEMVKDYYQLLEQDLRKMEIYSILAKKYRLQSTQVRLQIKKMIKNIE